MASKAVTNQLEEIKGMIEVIKDELEEKFDNHSEKWQESEKGEICMSNIEALQNAIDALDEVQ